MMINAFNTLRQLHQIIGKWEKVRKELQKLSLF